MSSHDQALLALKSGSDIYRIDKLRRLSIAVHMVIVAYVATGWLINWRTFLFVYLLVLPAILLQWILNYGSSIVANFENLIRIGRWDDDENVFQGAFFQTVLRDAGLVLPNTAINAIACILMFFFWVEALWRMILIVVPPPP
jgi:hypothetical protein